MKPGTKMQQETPLKWPEGWERTLIAARQKQGSWRRTFAQYTDALMKELNRMGVGEFILYRSENERLDPGVAVYFSKNMREDYSWQSALGLDTPAPTLSEIDDAYRKKAMQHHPDRGGDVEIFRALTKHRDQAKAWVLGTHKSEHEYVIACDRFVESRQNLAAICMALRALRQLERVGVSSILERTFRGFKTALMAHGETSETPAA